MCRWGCCVTYSEPLGLTRLHPYQQAGFLSLLPEQYSVTTQHSHPVRHSKQPRDRSDVYRMLNANGFNAAFTTSCEGLHICRFRYWFWKQGPVDTRGLLSSSSTVSGGGVSLSVGQDMVVLPAFLPTPLSPLWHVDWQDRGMRRKSAKSYGEDILWKTMQLNYLLITLSWTCWYCEIHLLAKC